MHGTVQAIRDAFEKFMNMRENKPGELLAKYLDSTLRSGTRKCSSEAELDTHLDSALALFRYLQACHLCLFCDSNSLCCCFAASCCLCLVAVLVVR
jgi:hypothetical protein